MKKVIIIFFVLFNYALQAQNKTENIIIITTDGFRWQDVFKGMDSAIANNSKYNQGDSSYIFSTYWSNDENERRKRKISCLVTSDVLSSYQSDAHRRKQWKDKKRNSCERSGDLMSLVVGKCISVSRPLGSLTVKRRKHGRCLFFIVRRVKCGY